MADIGIAWIAALVAPTLEVAFRNDPKSADSRDRSAVVAVQFVAFVAVAHDLAVEAARQFEVFDEHISWIEVTVPMLAITVTTAEIAWIVPAAIESRRPLQGHPSRLDVTDVVITVTIAWIEIHCPSSMPFVVASTRPEMIIGSWGIASNSQSERVGRCEAAGVLRRRPSRAKASRRAQRRQCASLRSARYAAWRALTAPPRDERIAFV